MALCYQPGGAHETLLAAMGRDDDAPIHAAFSYAGAVHQLAHQ